MSNLLDMPNLLVAMFIACFVVESVLIASDTSAQVRATSQVNVVQDLRAYQLKSWSPVFIPDKFDSFVKSVEVTNLCAVDVSSISSASNTTFHTWLFTLVTSSVASNFIQFQA